MAENSTIDIKALQEENKQITNFGLLLTFFLGLFGCIAAYKGNDVWRYLVGIGAALGFIGLIAPGLMRPLYRAWMKLAQYLGWFTTRLVLTIFFFVVLTPAGILARIFRADLIDKKIDRSAGSYWIEYQQCDRDPEKYERRF